ncbi:hypothetical protein [Paraflavitalea speifideaquila]|uniref:hypothetical protein n=1 Tax=Paraflavitalea speifideaquila TaxID=3076558 RepID=UPI0028EA9C1C|nr:hypothetical protein [Paraflavitalea speifideiaquila]
MFQDAAFIRLYPESGSLVHGHASKTAIEIKNGQGIPIATKGQVLANGTPIVAFQTDLSGSGIISWLPQQNKVYTLQIEDNSRLLVYQFPPVAATGYSLHLKESIIEDTTFQIEIGTPGKSSLHLIAHNYRTSFFSGSQRVLCSGL